MQIMESKTDKVKETPKDEGKVFPYGPWQWIYVDIVQGGLTLKY